MSGYLDAIPALGGSSAGMLGKATQSLVGMPAVTAAFDKLGLSQDMVGMFTPILVELQTEMFKNMTNQETKQLADLLDKLRG